MLTEIIIFAIGAVVGYYACLYQKDAKFKIKVHTYFKSLTKKNNSASRKQKIKSTKGV